MQSHLSNPWTYAVSYLEMLNGSWCLGSGSCFFWAHRDRTFVLTNWHNFAGRHRATNRPLHTTGAIPDRARFWVFRRVSGPDADGLYEFAYEPVEVPLWKDDPVSPDWLEHPTFGRTVDVGARDVTESVQGYEINHANTLEADAVIEPVTAQDIFVIGFPFGKMVNAPAPIWKRGTIALDPNYDPDGLLQILLDTATREGMSGSVVVARHKLVGRSHLKKDGSQSEPVLFGTRDLVVGIYSGRLYPDFEKAQIGIVWKRSTIEETVAGSKRGLCLAMQRSGDCCKLDGENLPVSHRRP